jgi:hypothetical protein
MARRGRIRLFWFYILLATIVSPLIGGCQPLSQSIQPFASTCKTDEELAAKERDAVNQLALQFVQDSVGPDPSIAYVSFTSDAKQNVPSDRFVAMFQNAIKPMGPFKDLRVAHTYIAKVTGASQEQRVVCGNLSKPSGWVAVNAKPGPAEAHIIVEGQTVNNTVVFAVWLIPEKGNWQVQYVHFAVAGMVGKSAEDLQRMAETEHQKQHDFNAFILYATALQFADRGPFFQLGIRPEIEKGIADVKRPDILQGQPPFNWEFGKSTFKVLNVGAIGVSAKIYLKIEHEIEPWAEDKEAERRNRDLIAAFGSKYSEYKDAFAGLVVRANERGGTRGFGTVDENQKPPNERIDSKLIHGPSVSRFGTH